MHLITSSPLYIIPTCTRIKNVLHGIIHASHKKRRSTISNMSPNSKA